MLLALRLLLRFSCGFLLFLGLLPILFRFLRVRDLADKRLQRVGGFLRFRVVRRVYVRFLPLGCKLLHLLLVVAVRSVRKTICLLYQTVERFAEFGGFFLHPFFVEVVCRFIVAVQFLQGGRDLTLGHRIRRSGFLKGFHGFLHVCIVLDRTLIDGGEEFLRVGDLLIPFVLGFH